MGARESDIADYACSREGPTRHAILIDPADQTPDMAAKRSLAAVAAGSSMVLVGGSSDTDMENVHETVVAIQEALELVEWASTQDAGTENLSKAPVVLFPQGAAALSPAADAITFMMLMNSTTPRFLIEEQVTGAPFIRKAGIEPIPMGYLICAPRGEGGGGRSGRPDTTGRERASSGLLDGSRVIRLQNVLLGGGQRGRVPSEPRTGQNGQGVLRPIPCGGRRHQGWSNGEGGCKSRGGLGNHR